MLVKTVVEFMMPWKGRGSYDVHEMQNGAGALLLS
jgi:hypothetical protein